MGENLLPRVMGNEDHSGGRGKDRADGNGVIGKGCGISRQERKAIKTRAFRFTTM